MHLHSFMYMNTHPIKRLRKPGWEEGKKTAHSTCGSTHLQSLLVAGGTGVQGQLWQGEDQPDAVSETTKGNKVLRYQEKWLLFDL